MSTERTSDTARRWLLLLAAFATPSCSSEPPATSSAELPNAADDTAGQPSMTTTEGSSEEDGAASENEQPGSSEGNPTAQGLDGDSIEQPEGNASGEANGDSDAEQTADGDTEEAAETDVASEGEEPTASPFPQADGTPRVFLASDSTVQTYGPNQAPQQGWGQRLQEFFSEDVVIVNRAIGGRSSKSFIDEGRLDDIVEELQRGDYLFAQWGINDRYRSDPARFTDPATTFRDYLRAYIDAALSKEAIPVLVTPTPRLHFENGEFQNDFVGYCNAIYEVGAETDTRVIDLQIRGLAYYTSIGLEQVEESIALDVLHFKEEGAFQMARLVSEGVKDSDLPIGQFVLAP